MTWVIGATTIFGYAVLVSDIRVTLADGSTRDVLQKGYRLGDFVAAGFAGSVFLGFELLRDLRDFLRKQPREEQSCWQPAWVAEHWSGRAKKIFRQSPGSERELGVDILLVGVDPDATVLGGGRPTIAVLRSPAFKPEKVTETLAFRHIGSGSEVAVYEQAMAGCLAPENFDLLKSEYAGPGAFGRLIGGALGRVAFNHPDPSVSRHMHILTVGVGNVTCHANNMTHHPHAGRAQVIEMPPVAESYSSLCKILSASETATCVASNLLRDSAC